MKGIMDFLWYCIRSMSDGFLALFGHAPDDFTWKEALTGGITFLVIIGLLVLLAWSLGIIIFKKK